MVDSNGLPKADPKNQQGTLFVYSPNEVCSAIGLNWFTARSLHWDGFLSFDPEDTPELLPSQEAELYFLGSLVMAGCYKGWLGYLLKDLEKPYSYFMSQIYFCWWKQRWLILPPTVPTMEMVGDWVVDSAPSEEIDNLEELRDNLTALIDSLREDLED